MSPVFGHGDLRLYLLKLLEAQPRHGYEIIRLLEDRFYGLYTPSAGTIYPRLAALEDDGLVTHEMVEGRKVYRITDAGRAELEARGEEMAGVEDRVRTSARNLSRDIRDEVRSSIRDLRAEIRDAAGQVRREERRNHRHWHEERHDDLGREVRRTVRALQADIRGLAADVVSAVRLDDLGKEAVEAIRTIVADARSAVLDVLDPERPERPENGGEP